MCNSTAHKSCETLHACKEDADDLMGELNFAQLVMEITAPLSQHGPIAGYDFIVDNGDDEDEPDEVSGDSNSSEDGEAVPATHS